MLPDEPAVRCLFGVIRNYGEVLGRKRRQLVYRDDYGIEKTDRWFHEIRYFIDNVLAARDDFEPMYEEFDGADAPLYYLLQYGDGVARFHFDTISVAVEHVASENREVQN